jgi:multiple sugar transport system permease protein
MGADPKAVPQPPARPGRWGWSKRTRRTFVTGILFISPWIIGFLVFTLYPMVFSLYTSFTIHHIRAPSQWVGLTNYANMLQDERLWKALLNTVYMVVLAVPLTIMCAFLLAVLLNMKVRGQSVYRVVYFLPAIVPVVATTILWLWIFNTKNGILNTLLGTIGIKGPAWLSDPTWSKPALVILGLWGMGTTIVIYLSGLQDVPKSLLEAAELDGASWWQRLRHVTIPMVSPITVFVLILGVIGMFQYFTQAYIFAQSGARGMGAPLDSTLFYSVYLYERAFLRLKFGYASAMAWLLFVIIMICTVVLLKFSERWTYYEDTG